MKLKDLTGQIFGKWTVLYRVQAHRKHTIWRCMCECGMEKDVYATHLVSGKSTRCLKCKPRGKDHHQWRGCGDISGDFWDSIKRGANGKSRRKPVEFSITIEYVWELFLKQDKKCALSGQEIRINYNTLHGHTASLDRIDSSLGYTIDNVQWVHKDVNMMKRTYDQEYFIDICKLIASHNTRGKYEI